jgi:hypothetical protein
MPYIPKKVIWVPPTPEELIFEQIKVHRAIPVLGNSISNDLLLSNHRQLILDFADHVDYPLADKDNLAHITQFVTIIQAKKEVSPVLVKRDYLDFIKSRLCDLAEADRVTGDLLDEVKAEFDNLDFSELAKRLGYPKFVNATPDPLLILAGLNLPIYLTTGYHQIMEVALYKAGKRPHTGICRWNRQLEKDIPDDIFASGYEPSVEEPLVYHLHGLDKYPTSLVLTEDDHLEFLVAISQEMGRPADRVHAKVREALTQCSLLLLGYNLQSWEFRTLFWGLLKFREIRQHGVHLQLNCEKELDYLKIYMEKADFEVSLESIQDYTHKLYDKVIQVAP